VAALIAARRAQDGIPHAVSCRALGVSRSWFCKWKDGRLPPRAARRQQLKAEIARLFGLHEGTYGSPRITADLKDAGWRVSENTVAALMREQGLAARSRHRRRGTTRPGKGRWRAPDLVKRDFPAKEVNKKWYGDGTEIPAGEGKLCLASSWTWPRAGCSGSRWASITMPSSLTERWRWRCAAARRRA
jgi:putative transposase